MGDNQIVDYLAQMQSPDPKVYQPAYEKLLQSESNNTTIENALASELWHTRYLALQIIRKKSLHKTPSIANKLIALMGDKNSDVRILSRNLIAELDNSISLVAPALKNENWRIRWGATKIIGYQQSPQHIPVLIQALDEENEDLRSLIRSVIITYSKEAIPFLIRSLRDKNSSIRLESQRTLIYLGDQGVEALANKIINETSGGRKIILGTLELLQQDALRLVNNFIQKLTESNSEKKAIIQTTLAILQDVATPVIIQHLHKMEADIKPIILQIGQPAIPILWESAKTRKSPGRKVAREILEQMGEKSLPSTSELIEEGSGYERRLAVELTGRIFLHDNQAITLLYQAMEHRLPDVKATARNWLSAHRHKAKQALSRSFTDPSWQVRWTALKIFPILANNDEILESIELGFQDENEEVKIAAKESLAAMEKAALPHLKKFLQHSNPEVRTLAAEALWLLGDIAGEILVDLIKSLKDKDWRVRFAVAETIGKMGEKASIAIPDLSTLLKDEDGDVVEAATKAIAAVGISEPSAPVYLAAALEHWSEDVRYHAVTGLGKIGQQNDSILPTLLKSLTDKDEKVVIATITAIQQMPVPNQNYIPSFIRLLQEDRPIIINQVSQILIDLGEPVVPMLAQALGDNIGANIKEDAAKILKEIAQKDNSKDLLTFLLHDTCPTVRWAAQNALNALN